MKTNINEEICLLRAKWQLRRRMAITFKRFVFWGAVLAEMLIVYLLSQLRQTEIMNGYLDKQSVVELLIVSAVAGCVLMAMTKKW